MPRSKSIPWVLVLSILALCAAAGCSDEETATEPADTTPPTITGHYPSDGATDVARSGPYWIAFSEPMDEEQVEDELEFDLDPWQYGCSWIEDTLLIVPYSLLDAGTMYTITVDGDCEDVAGNAIGADYPFSFTTTTQADNTPPEIVSTVPADGATNVNPGEPIIITFSEPMNLTTTSNAIEFDPEPTDYEIEWEGLTMTVLHYPFPQNTTVTVTVSTTATDLSGNHLAASYSFDFHTLIDTIRPYLASASPANDATGVQTSLNQIELNFSEPMFPEMHMPPENVDARINHDIDGENGEWNDDYSSMTVPVRSGIDLLSGCTYWVKFQNMTDMAGNPIDPNPTEYRFTTSGTPLYFLYEPAVVWFNNISKDDTDEWRYENYSSGSGTFDIVFTSYGEIRDVWHMKRTGTEIQHLGRDEYEGGAYALTMTWDDPLPYLKLPIQSHTGETWYFSTGAALDPDHTMTLDGSVHIEDYPVNLVSEELGGTFRGCYVHHLMITVTFYEYGTPTETNTMHETTWLAEGLGCVKAISEESGHGADTLVVVDWDI